MSLESWKKFYSWFPDDFWQDGGKYTFETLEEDYVYYYCDDCDSFHYWYRTVEYEFRGNDLWLVELSNYECGDTEFHDEHKVPEDPTDLEAKLSNDYHKLALRRQIEYCEWMVEENRDPCNLFWRGEPAEMAEKELPGLRKWLESLEARDEKIQ